MRDSQQNPSLHPTQPKPRLKLPHPAWSNSPMPAPPADPNPLAALRAENREHYRAILRRVIDHGAIIVEALDPAFTDPVALAAAYHGVARAIRQGIMLADKLAEPIPEPREPSQAATPEPTRTEPAEAPKPERLEAPKPERLEAPERERLEAPEPPDQLPDRPIEDILLDIRRALGLLPTARSRSTLPIFEPRAALAELADNLRDDDDDPPPRDRFTTAPGGLNSS